MASVYPTTIDTFTVKEDLIDPYAAAHMNKVQDAIVAAQTSMGTNPQGQQTSLDIRLSKSLSPHGGIAYGTAFPGAEFGTGRPFWRTDLNTFYVHSGAAWVSQGVSLSNVAFNYTLGDGYFKASGTLGYAGVASVDATGVIASTAFALKYWASYGTNFHIIIRDQFVRTSGMSTITYYCYLQTSEPTKQGQAQVDIGGVASTAVTVSTHSDRQWVTNTIDVTGLDVGTVYDLSVALRNLDTNHATGMFYAKGIIS